MPQENFRRRVTSLTPEQRFAGALHLSPTLVAASPPAPWDSPPDLTVDVVRGRDLVSLTARFWGVRLDTTQNPPVVSPHGGAPHLMVIEYPFQHGHEAAQYVIEAGTNTKQYVPDPGDPSKPPKPDPAAPAVSNSIDPVLPVGFRAARTSRLVFTIGPEDSVVFTRAGILRAMTALSPVLHPQAQPPGVRGDVSGTSDGRIVWINDSLIAVHSAAGVLVTKASAAQKVQNPPPDPTTVTGALALARGIRQTLAQGLETGISLASGIAAAAAPSALGQLIDLGRFHIDPSLFGKYSSDPTPLQTAIEAPYRLIISPNGDGRWLHAEEPVDAEQDARHVELWHSRLAVTGPSGTPDERIARTRIVRAIWARDRDGVPASVWRKPEVAGGPLSTPSAGDDKPFRGSLNRSDRHMLVRQTAERWPGISDARSIAPVGVDKLWLSSLGAWLDLHGAWYTKEYSHETLPSILAWDHVAPMGRDQFVRVVYPGYLYPFGQPTALVKITERRITTTPNTASLYQFCFLVISDPRRDYSGDASRGFSHTRIDLSPAVTPPIADPGTHIGDFFWPSVGSTAASAEPLRFTVNAWDHDGAHQSWRTPLLWVAERFHTFSAVDQEYDKSAHRVMDLAGQKVAFAPQTEAGDTRTETAKIRVRGRATLGTATPYLSSADVVVDAAKRLAGLPSVPIQYTPTYLEKGWDAAANAGQVWAGVLLDSTKTALQLPAEITLTDAPNMSFGTPSAGSDRAGGFVQPDVPIRGLSIVTGAVGDIAGMQTQSFNPIDFFAGALPKLFGLVSITDLVKSAVGDLGAMPKVITETLDGVGRVLKDLETLRSVLDEAQHLDPAASVAAFASDIATHLAAIPPLLDPTTLGGVGDIDARIAAVQAELEAMGAVIVGIPPANPKIPPLLRKRIDELIATIKKTLSPAAIIAVLDDVRSVLSLLDPAMLEGVFSYEWKPQLFERWPATGLTLIEMPKGAFTISVQGRVSGQGAPTVSAMAEIRNLTLHLFGKENEGGAPLVQIPFEHIAFSAGSSGKAEVDVVLGELKFVGILAFVEVLKDFIPFDGFSDPPFIEVDTAGLRAGFTLAIPTVAIGVFALSNISLGADVQVPFLGKSLSFGFNFCTREQPFNLSVLFIGGGGWFMIRLTPEGLDVVELGLEAGATLAVDFGVASGSISCMIGIYLRLESKKGQLTGYFRLRGEVDVLGIASASIELYMALTYQFDTGKMVGEATITVSVSVLCFSGSVSISARREFAGSNGDPSFAQIMMDPGGTTSDAWDSYWGAFALAGVGA